VRKRTKVKRPSSERVPLHLARSVNEVWSKDFVSDSLANGRRLKCLSVADDFSHECADIAVDFGIGGEYVTRLFDGAAIFRGYPSAVRTDNWPEFTSRAFMAWAHSHGARHILIPWRRNPCPPRHGQNSKHLQIRTYFYFFRQTQMNFGIFSPHCWAQLDRPLSPSAPLVLSKGTHRYPSCC
jgi:hypothetical protein